MNQPPLSISLVTYNSAGDIPGFLESLRQQTFQNFEFIVVDNASTDNSMELIKNLWPSARCFPQTENLGYGEGHNRAMSAAQSQYILLANVDLVLDPTCLERLIASAEAHPEAGSIGGKLLKLQNLKTPAKLGIIDSTGLCAFRNRRFVDRGEGETDSGQYDFAEEVFGISGALVLFRRSALEAVQLSKGEYLDRRYFMYREDIDLAWRLQKAGWNAWYTPLAVAHHRRGGGGAADSGSLDTAKRRKQKSSMVNFYSYRNHLLTLLKNETLGDFILDAPWILWYEWKKIVFLMLFERATLRAWQEVWHNRRSTQSARRQGQRVTVRSVRQWFLHAWTSPSSS